MSLRTPLLLNGPLAKPRITVAPEPLAAKLAAGAILAAVHPLAALLTLMDYGDKPVDTNQGCAASLKRLPPAAKPADK